MRTQPASWRVPIVLRLLPLLLAAAPPLPAAEAQGTDQPVDRVGFPADYARSLEQIRHSYFPTKDKVITVFANPAAASVKNLAQVPYPAGSVIVFEWADPQKDTGGKPRQDDAGRFLKGPITRVDVIRHEAGYGAGYGEDRAGEWEFASYLVDGTSMKLPEGGTACARCHQRAGPERDFVFAGRFAPAK